MPCGEGSSGDGRTSVPRSQGRATWGSRGRHLPRHVWCWWPRCSRATCRRRRRRSAAREASGGRGGPRAGEPAEPEPRGERRGVERRPVRARRHAGSSSSIGGVCARQSGSAASRSRTSRRGCERCTRAATMQPDDARDPARQSSVSEILDRLDAARAVAAADRRLTEQATAARNRYARAARAAAAVVHRRTVALEQRDRERKRIGGVARRAQAPACLGAVGGRDAEAAAEEAARQAKLRAEARARLAAEARARRAAATSRCGGRGPARAATTPTTTAPAAPTTTAAAPPPPATTTTTIRTSARARRPGGLGPPGRRRRSRSATSACRTSGAARRPQPASTARAS